MNTLYYAGIGSRETPPEILRVMTQIGEHLANLGVVLRTGGASGADSAFENGCDSVNAEFKEIWIPWNGFNNISSKYIVNADPNGKAMQLAAEMHPAWERCSQGVKKLHARNSHQILGADLNTPVSLVICYTKNGAGQGGTGQAIRLAKKYNIPVCDLGIYKTPEEALNGALKAIDAFIITRLQD